MVWDHGAAGSSPVFPTIMCHDKQNMDEKIFINLGKIVFNFSAIEFLLGAFITRLISEDKKVGLIAIANTSFRARLDMLPALIKHKNPEKDVSEIIKKLSGAEERRNQIFHSVYAYKDEKMQGDISRLKTSLKRTQGIKHDEEIISSSDLGDFVTSLANLMIELKELHEATFPKEEIGF